jgi:hypothetical protein
MEYTACMNANCAQQGAKGQQEVRRGRANKYFQF